MNDSIESNESFNQSNARAAREKHMQMMWVPNRGLELRKLARCMQMHNVCCTMYCYVQPYGCIIIMRMILLHEELIIATCS